jgi:hypothetical protein
MRASTAAIALFAVATPILATDIKVVRHSKTPIFGTMAESETTEWISATAKRVEGSSDLQAG